MTGAERAEARAEDGALSTHADWLGPAESDAGAAPAAEPSAAMADEAGDRPQTPGRRALGAFLLLLAIAWTGAVGWLLWRTHPPMTLQTMISWTATLSGPLVLLGLLWLLLGRSSRRETERFTRAVEEMRRESNALETVLEIVAARIEENHARLRGEAEKLMSLGDEASDRLGRVTYYLSKETQSLDRKAAELESAAAAAKVDIGVLMSDLPRAEAQARAVSDAMKEAGLNAHGQASALEAQLGALGAKGREADEVLGGAAQRLAAHVARIESSAGTAATRIDEASAGMASGVDAAMARAAEAVEQARAALDAQGQTTLAAIEQSQAALERAGADAAQRLSGRLEEVSTKVEALAGHLSAQDAASHALVTGLTKELAELDTGFEQLGRTGAARSESLTQAVHALRDGTRALIEELSGGTQEATALSDRAEALAGALAQVGGQLGEVRGRAAEAANAMGALTPVIQGVEQASDRLDERLAGVAGRVEAIAARASEQDAATRALVEALLRDVATLDATFAGLETEGGARTTHLLVALASVHEAVAALDGELGRGGEQAGLLTERAREMNAALADAAARLGDELPAALGRAEAQATRTREAAEALAPVVGEVERSAAAAGARLSETASAISGQREAVDALLARIDEGASGAEERLTALGASATEAREAAARIAAETGPELIEALLRVREAATQASERAREAISAVIPASAASLGEAGREALTRVVEEIVAAQMDELSALAERSVETARRSSERLTRQMLKLGETTAAIEARIDEERRGREERDADHFSRRVALLIESLNSTAIDVTKILSNEVTDSAWAAYLKGDRGVFTRRAVRLLDNSEVREIARHYEEEPEFREQVNRYIHDFESMLRRVLADREGNVLGVTILSSDMGKLYVALAQAIERLR